MLSLFRKFISNSSESSQFAFADETKLEIFIFNLPNKQWSESISGTIFIEKLQPPQTSLMIIKLESHPYNLIRKITRDFELSEKDEKTWMFRVHAKTKSSDYNESNIIACRFSTTTIAKSFRNFIKNLQLEKAGFENLNFRLETIRKNHENEILEKESALQADFPRWDDLLNGKYYKNFYNHSETFRCVAETREFDSIAKKWKQLILAIVKIEILPDTGQNILTVAENDEFIRLGITRDVELIALDNRTWMWRGYKKSTNIQSLLIGCRFINSKIARNFGVNVIKAQEYAPSRCRFRDEFMSEIFKKEQEIKLSDDQIALATNFPGEYEITDDDADFSRPSTSKVENAKSSKTSWIECGKTIFSLGAKFRIFESETKKWKEIEGGTVQIVKDEEGNISILMKSTEKEFFWKLSEDSELMKKDSRSFIWRVGDFSIFLMTEFESPEICREFEKSLKNVRENSVELLSDEIELSVLKNLFDIESQEKLSAFDVDFPSHVDLGWLSGANVTKWRRRNEEIADTDFGKVSLFNSKVDIYNFDKIANEWRKLTGLPGSVVIKRKQFQEFQKTILYAISDEFRGTIVVKCEIAGNFNLEMKNKTSWIWRGFVEMENGERESLLIGCRFSNFEIAKNFKAIVADVRQHSPWRCFLRDEFLAGILKNVREKLDEENRIALNGFVE